MENSKIYLCKADCSILGNISGLKIETCSLKKNAVVQWELTFEVERYTNDNLCELKQTDYYDSIDTMMRLYLDGKEQAFFVIDEEPAIHGEGLQETKTVTAHSIECELSYLNIKNFKINCGTKDSQEYLVTDSTGNFNNINPYTNLPYEYISLVNYNNPQLSLLHLALQNTGWAVDENIDTEICNIKKSFEVSNENIYSFLMDTVSSSASVIFQFDRKNKKIALVKAEDFGEDTGIFISMRNLMNRFEINSSSNDELITKLVPTGANNLGIEQVVFGKDYIINLDYFMNTLNEYGDYKYVSKELHDKYIVWKNYRETDKITFNGKQYTRREQYIELTKLYNQTILDINDLKNRVPNDGAVTDYKTFSLEELKLHLNAFNKALVSLITLYKNEYGVTEIGSAPNYTPTPSSAVNIKNTPYWHDFYAYQESIIPQIKEALKMYCQTDSNGNLITDINGHFIEMEFGNPAYYVDPSIVKEVDAYKYEWSLYGLDELESKKKAWSEVSNILFNECFIKSGTTAAPTAYRTPDDNGWNSLSDKQKKEFTSKSAYIDKLNQYLDYMSFDVRNNSLTKTKCKGIIRQCNDAILTRKNEIKSLENLQNSYSTQRSNLANSVSLENFRINNNLLFTEKDLNVINSMIREKDYNNSNILTTNLDDIVSTIDAQEELYQAAIKELCILSQPQYSFQTELDNLYALEEFQSYHDSFDVGNFIRVGFEIHEELFDFNFRKLRLISIEYNPLQSDENLSIEFSTMVRGLENVSDMSFLIGKDSSSSSGSSSSSSGGSGTYGNNDANVQMSNNMLNALLSTELFGTTVTDVILDSIKGNKGNFNTLLSHSGVFDSLEAGRIKISGECLFDTIKSSNYVAGKSGSMLDLLNGNFDFAGGKLKWNGTNLSVEGNGTFTGNIIANSLKLGQNVKIDNSVITGLSKVATSGDFNDLSNTSGILMTDDVMIESITDANGVTTKTITVGEHTYTTKESDNYILTNVGLGTNTDKHDESFFKVSKNGLLEANNALIYGTVYATNGRFAGEVIATSGTFTGNISSTATISGGTISGATISGGTISGGTIEINTKLYNNNADYRVTLSSDKGIELSPKYIHGGINSNHDSLVTLNPAYGIGFGTVGNTCDLTTALGMVHFNNDVHDFPSVFLNSNGLFLNTVENDEEMSGGSSTGKLKKDIIFSKQMICHPKVYTLGITDGKELYIGSNGMIGTNSSSKRYKNSISNKLTHVSNPHGLYKIDVVQFKYNRDYLSSANDKNSEQKMYIGLIAEDVEKFFPNGVTYDEDGQPNGWSLRYMFPAALKLIQEQHKELILLKKQMKSMKQQFQRLKTCNNNQL